MNTERERERERERGRRAASLACCHATASVGPAAQGQYAPRHRVSRPRGTGSVGDSVGEGQTHNRHTRGQTAWRARNPIPRRKWPKRWCWPPSPSPLLVCPPLSARVCQRVNVRAPTLSPTDPVPRGLLTLCPWASSGPQGLYTAYIQRWCVRACVRLRVVRAHVRWWGWMAEREQEDNEEREDNEKRENNQKCNVPPPTRASHADPKTNTLNRNRNT